MKVWADSLDRQNEKKTAEVWAKIENYGFGVTLLHRMGLKPLEDVRYDTKAGFKEISSEISGDCKSDTMDSLKTNNMVNEAIPKLESHTENIDYNSENESPECMTDIPAKEFVESHCVDNDNNLAETVCENQPETKIEEHYLSTAAVTPQIDSRTVGIALSNNCKSGEYQSDRLGEERLSEHISSENS